jgi:hypothetical protein
MDLIVYGIKTKKIRVRVLGFLGHPKWSKGNETMRNAGIQDEWPDLNIKKSESNVDRSFPKTPIK